MKAETPKKVTKRTARQNRAMHKFFRMLSDELNKSGLDQRVVLKPSVSIPWTPQAVKEQLWRPIQRALYGKISTTDLAKSEEPSHIHEVLMRHLGETHGIEYIEWPHHQSEEDYIKETTSTT